MKASKRLKRSLDALRDQGVPFSPIANLKPWKDNPRLNAAAVPAVMASMNKFGWTSPVLIRARDSFVEAGHTRLLAARNLGLMEVPVIRLEHSENDARLYALADNRTAELAEWSPDLPRLLESFKPDDLAASGFDDVGKFLAEHGLAAAEVHHEAASSSAISASTKNDTASGGNGAGDDIGGGDPVQQPEPDSGPVGMPADVNVALGEMYELGRHRLLIGDSTSPDNVARLMGGQQASTVVTDPPYAIFGSSSGIEADIADDKMVLPFFRSVVGAIVAATKPFSHWYICCDWRSWASWWAVVKATPARPKNMVVWDKAGGMGSSYANCHELLMFGSIIPMKDQMRTDKSQVGIRVVNGANIWRINRALKMEDGSKRKHNAQKPVELYVKAFENSSDEGDVVADLFAGSGTCFIAAERIGRACRAMEVDPRWAELSISRWEKFTGRKAKRIG